VTTHQLSAWRPHARTSSSVPGAEQLVFFVAGFIFDSVMIRRIDDALVLLQQAPT
jgi:hypothetical protein